MRSALAGESACPTLTLKGLRMSGAGAFACEPIFSQLLTVAVPKEFAMFGQRYRAATVREPAPLLV
jgi:hypothetical protein